MLKQEIVSLRKQVRDLENWYATSMTQLTGALKRLAAIRLIIERAENCAMAVDGPVDGTISHMTDSDIQNIWILAADYKNPNKKVRK